MTRLFVILLLFGCQGAGMPENEAGGENAQQAIGTTGFQLSARVDTTKQEVLDVLQLYTDYMQSSPEFVFDNPHWNAAEKALYEDFDLSRQSLFQGLSSGQLLGIYTPFVLSIEPLDSKYQIRVMYASSELDPEFVGSKVWCIHRLNAIQENGHWKLENLLVEHTKSWHKKQLGFIEYIYPADHEFLQEEGDRALTFCTNITKRFNPAYNDNFKFYLTNSIDQMGTLENFDYYFVGITTGKAKEGMVLTAKGNAFYPHEFVHKLLPTNANRGHVIEEGLATFLGTKEDLPDYLVNMKMLAQDYNVTPSFTLENILNNTTDWNGYPAAYPGGALVCEIIHEQKGDAGLCKLIAGHTNNYQEIMALMGDVLELEMDKVIELVGERLEGFK